MKRQRFLIAALAAALLSAALAKAEEPSRLEFFVRGAWTPGTTGPAYSHSYNPHPGFDIAGSYARQTLQIDPLAGRGLQAGVIFFFGRTLGLRFTLNRDIVPLGGVNSNFEMSYQYRIWLPWTGFQFVEGTYAIDQGWPDTSGALRRTAPALELVARVPLGPGLSLNFSGGPFLSFFDGDVHSLYYTELTYERYGAFFFSGYFVRLRLPAVTALGFTGGAELELRLGRHLAIVVDAAYRSGTYIGTPEVMAAYDYDSVLEARTDVLARIKAAIAPGPVELTPSPFVFGAGLAVSF